MKANPDKYYLLMNNTEERFQIKFRNETVSNSKYGKLLGIKVDHELNFNQHVSSLCKKANQKLNTLSRLVSSLTFDQRRLILNSFTTSHFSYSPIAWISHSRKLNKRVNSIHERALRIVYKDFKPSLQEFLIEDNYLNIHRRNLQKLVTESSKLKWLITWAHKWYFRLYRKTILSRNNFVFQVEEDPYNKIWHRNTFLPWSQIMEPCSKWIYNYWITCRF